VEHFPTTQFKPATFPTRPGLRSAPLTRESRERTGEQPFVKLNCSLCRCLYLLDVEEHWHREPPEMETIGRKFLGVSADAMLCSRCLHEVETAGAERIYWSHACW
jgi:hypothetical protein